MKKIALNTIVIIFTAPIVAFTAIVGGLISGLYYSLFYLYTKTVMAGEKIRVNNQKTIYRN